jgi:hypothetical protein
MAKKPIISDFSALKGKVSFSEQTPASKESKLPKSMQPEDGVLKVGMNVVLMDSDLRGKIVTLGKTVGIELEDGMIIQAAYGEFAVTDKAEIDALKQSKARVKKTSAGSSGKVSGSGVLTVDLHIEAIPGGRSVPKGQRLQFQMDLFKKVIRENLQHKGLKINFIHGIGDGILKAAIRKELDEVLSLRCSYSVGDPAITAVTIR